MLAFVLKTRTGLALRSYVACLEERYLCEHRSYELIYENREERDVRNYLAHLAKLLCLYRHTERDSRLREKRYAEVFDDMVVALDCLGTRISAEILARAACQNIDKSDEDYYPILVVACTQTVEQIWLSAGALAIPDFPSVSTTLRK